MTLHQFRPNYRPVAVFDGHASPAALLAEQGMYAASEQFARTHGGPLTQRILDAIPEDYRRAAADANLEPNIDIRIHDLTSGDYPASPGWHCDSPFREVAFDDLAPTLAVQRNLVATISSSPDGVSNTEFLDDPIAIESQAPTGSYALWHALDAHVRAAPRRTSTSRDGTLLEFDCNTIHRATVCSRPGVRLFCRISLWKPPPGHRPGLTLNEQVYRRVPLPHLTPAKGLQ